MPLIREVAREPTDGGSLLARFRGLACLAGTEEPPWRQGYGG